MLSRLQIKNILKNVDKVTRPTLLKKAKQLGLEVKKNISDTKLRQQIKKTGERQIDKILTIAIKQFNEERRQRIKDAQFKTNSQGVKIHKNDYNAILSLQNEYNAKKERILNNYIQKRKKEGNEISQVEIDFLKGKTVRHVNSSENIELNVNFRKENLIDSISPGVDLNFYKKTIQEEIKKFKISNVIQNRSNKLNSFLKTWQDSMELTENQVKEIQDLYKNMNVIEKSQFNKDLEHKMAMVESVTKNPRSRYDTYHALKEIVFLQEDRKFVTS